MNDQKRKEFADIVREERLKESKARAFIASSWERGSVPEYGQEPGRILPSLSPFDPTADWEGKLQRVLGRLKAFFAKYYEIADGSF